MLNRITVMGRLTRDPELRYTPNGTAVCHFSLACDRDYKDASGNKSTDFLDIVAWRAAAEFVSKYLSKGRLAIVDGRLQLRDWTDNDGRKRRNAEILANSVNFGDSKPQGQTQPDVGGEYADAGYTARDLQDSSNLPF